MLTRLSLTAALLSTLAVDAQQRPTKFQWLEAKDAPTVAIIKVLQDKHGIMWFGTRVGLYRYDSHTIRRFGEAELSKGSFVSTTSELMFEDRSGQFWIGTGEGALLQYDRNTDEFTPVNDTTHSFRARLYDQVEDKDGRFWLSTLGAGLFRYDPVTGETKNYQSSVDDARTLPSNFVPTVAYTPDGTLWVGTVNGLCKYNQQTDDFTRVPLTNNDPQDEYRYKVIRHLYVHSDGKLYIGSYKGLHVYDPATGKSEHLINDPRKSRTISGNSIFKICGDRTGKLWIATYGGGLNRYDPKTGYFENWQFDSSDPNSIPTNNLFDIAFDRDSTLWVGTADNGISMFKPKNRGIQSIYHRPNDPSSLAIGSVRSLFHENDSIAWVGFNGSGLDRLNILTGRATHHVYDPGDKTSIGNNAVTDILKDDNGNLWLSTEGGGLNMMNMATGKFTRYQYHPTRNSIGHDAIGSIAINNKRQMWIMTYGRILNRFDLDTRRFTRLSFDSLSQAMGIAPRYPATIKQVGNLTWFFQVGGLLLHDGEKFSSIPVAKLSNQPNALLNDYSADGNDLLVLDNKNTITRLKINSWENISISTVYSEPDARPEFDALQMDSKGSIWVFTTEKMIRIDAAGKRADFDPSDVVSVRAYAANKDSDDKGHIFFSRYGSFNWFNVDEIDTRSDTRPVLLTDFKVFNNSAPIAAPGKTINTFKIPAHISRLKEINLTHLESFFSFEFSSLEYYDQDRIQYAYQMVGFDRDWIEVGNQRFAPYTNLDPGRYTFQVRASTGQGWHSEPTSIEVIIHPPFWKTWWFLSLEVLVVLMIAYMMMRYRIAQSVKLERIRNKIASDLHDEVGANLTRISMYSELLEQQIRDGSQRGYLQSIRSLSREVVSTMGDMIWSIDNRSDSLGDLMMRMKNFALEVFEAKGITTTFDEKGIDTTRILDPAVKQNLYLIFKESVTNILKHSEATEVHIRLTGIDRQIVMSIHDNGKGFIHPNGDDVKGNGLRNLRRRSDSIDARLDIRSGAGGTTVELVFPESR